MRSLITDPAELLELVGLTALPGVADKHAIPDDFALRVPRAFVARMRPGDPTDPLLRQVLPIDDEGFFAPGYVDDPVGDQPARVAAGLLHKYDGRALAITTGACAVHCRYCFRRHFPYSEETAAAGDWQAVTSSLVADPSIEELILSGGDPLVLGTAKLRRLSARIDPLAQIRRLRIHTRVPVVIPARVTDDLLDWLSTRPQRVVIVLHINHAQEIDTAVRVASERLAQTGALLLNQAVLLRGVNDSAQAQINLSQALFEAQVMPYYLHQLDRVRGAAHFEVADATALRIVAEARAALPGYLVPRLVREVAGQDSKTPID